jgi:hypothetical protein
MTLDTPRQRVPMNLTVIKEKLKREGMVLLRKNNHEGWEFPRKLVADPRKRRWVCASTPSDRRAIHNCIAELRRILIPGLFDKIMGGTRLEIDSLIEAQIQSGIPFSPTERDPLMLGIPRLGLGIHQTSKEIGAQLLEASIATGNIVVESETKPKPELLVGAVFKEGNFVPEENEPVSTQPVPTIPAPITIPLLSITQDRRAEDHNLPEFLGEAVTPEQKQFRAMYQPHRDAAEALRRTIINDRLQLAIIQDRIKVNSGIFVKACQQFERLVETDMGFEDFAGLDTKPLAQTPSPAPHLHSPLVAAQVTSPGSFKMVPNPNYVSPDTSRLLNQVALSRPYTRKGSYSHAQGGWKQEVKDNVFAVFQKFSNRIYRVDGLTDYFTMNDLPVPTRKEVHNALSQLTASGHIKRVGNGEYTLKA